jgi:hypothetical protein
LVVASAAYIVIALCASVATAHDLHGLVAERNSLEPDVRAKFDEIQELRRLLAARAAANPQDGQSEAVVQRALLWPGSKVSVCFFDGGAQARDHISQVAQKWTQATALEFDFGPTGNRQTCDPAKPSDVRVSFRGVGYYSYVGTQAKYINSYKQTLNLQGMDKTNFTQDDDGIILHEFGHAIGFEHEHQSPASGCDEEFDWNYLYTSMGWTKEEVERNMRRLSIPSGKLGLLVTAFDRSSVMLYSLAPKAFKNPGTAGCYIPSANNDISPLDRQAVQTVYPTVVGAPSPVSAPQVPTSPDAVSIAASIRRLKDLTNTVRVPY